MDKKQLAEILLEMRNSSLLVSANPTDENIKGLMNKYDMLFLGENLNCIDSITLAHSLEAVFNIHIDIKDLNNVIPEICSSLNMKCEPLIDVSEISNPSPPIACYRITL